MPPNSGNALVTSVSLLMVSTDVQMDGGNSDGGLRLGASRGKKSNIHLYGTYMGRRGDIGRYLLWRQRRATNEMCSLSGRHAAAAARRHISEVIHYVLHSIARLCRTATTTRSIQLYVRRWRIRALRQRANAFSAVTSVKCRSLSRVLSAFVSLLIISTNVVGVAYEMDWWVRGSIADVWRHLLLYSRRACQSSTEY